MLGGIEISPWKHFGITLEGGLNFTQTFDTADYSRLGGSLRLGAVYRL